MSTEVRIFNMDDCTWIAAANIDDAWRGFAEFYSYDISTPAGVEEARSDNHGYEPEELTDADLDRLTFHAHDLGDSCNGKDDEGRACPVSFREQLERMKLEGVTFPCFFATTEY